ncbi:MAG: Asp-tRNA(Asn)/Glu-tRNA(Gln) amidotransferase subunit GatC [Candidatus Omnitrophica bacterium]|nr:Asp-tRNA(Asn)/Glu-tRNA(Gln) amidotransferase subunit GatC [Candidatus Omnitrophota bacterium]MDD4013619.1 Asp-tRNA(Asn)/Glu-tRNA(Gln) amidotransferase subunit GatC [Candidatus Omnitrophota bacterium]
MDNSGKTISDDMMRHVAALSRLHLEENKVEAFRTQISRILDYVAQLEEVDTEGVQPTSHVLSSMKNVFREDETKDSLPPDAALANAPERQNDLFRVPKVIKDA